MALDTNTGNLHASGEISQTSLQDQCAHERTHASSQSQANTHIQRNGLATLGTQLRAILV